MFEPVCLYYDRGDSRTHLGRTLVGPPTGGPSVFVNIVPIAHDPDTGRAIDPYTNQPMGLGVEPEETVVVCFHADPLGTDHPLAIRRVGLKAFRDALADPDDVPVPTREFVAAVKDLEAKQVADDAAETDKERKAQADRDAAEAVKRVREAQRDAAAEAAKRNPPKTPAEKRADAAARR